MRTDDGDSLDDGSQDWQESVEDLGPILELLERGTPENGIDLVPRWNRLLVLEQAALEHTEVESRKPPSSSHRSLRHRLFGSMGYATVLALGLGAGLLASGWSSTPIPSKHCDYTSVQKNLMFRLLDQTTSPSRQTLSLASIELDGCVACHESALQPLPRRLLP